MRITMHSPMRRSRLSPFPPSDIFLERLLGTRVFQEPAVTVYESQQQLLLDPHLGCDGLRFMCGFYTRFAILGFRPSANPILQAAEVKNDFYFRARCSSYARETIRSTGYFFRVVSQYSNSARETTTRRFCNSIPLRFRAGGVSGRMRSSFFVTFRCLV